MPLINDMNISSGDLVSSEDLYHLGIFHPETIPDNLEILNGGLDSENYGAGNQTIEPFMCQFGSFALGYFSGFEKEHAIYARQVSDGQAIIHSSLSASIYLPWQASALIYGYQGFFNQDATLWDTDGVPQQESWTIKLTRRNLGGASDEKEESRAVLPWARDSLSIPDNTADVHPGFSRAKYWKYVHKHQMETGVPKGYHDFQVKIQSTIKYPDYGLAKVKTVIGAFYVLAIR
tara:strand:+ start:206 stop:904 length:699 start_codon:yes stop_codon:yes gene_type:complete